MFLNSFQKQGQFLLFLALSYKATTMKLLMNIYIIHCISEQLLGKAKI